MSCAIKSPRADVASSGTRSWAARYAEQLLADLGNRDQSISALCDHPAVAWKRAGLLSLSGDPTTAPRMLPLPISSAADGALLALKALALEADNLPATGAELLGERAQLMQLTRNGRNSPSGHCRLIDCSHGRIALNLARQDDWELLPALLEGETPKDWEALSKACRTQNADDLVAKGVVLGMAIAKDEVVEPAPWIDRQRYSNAGKNLAKPLVIDLSALWAGPLAASLLGHMGAEIIKVESTHRPDGAREGNAAFYDLLNAGKRSVAIDFRSDEGRRQLRKLVEAADIVIEASRPRALRQLGIDAEALLASKRGKVWLRILAHGDDQNRIGFGDDIGVAAGLPSVMEQAHGQTMMVGDAIADPLSGLHGALAAWHSWQSGGGELLTISMRDVVRNSMQSGELDLKQRAGRWQRLAEDSDARAYPLRKPIKRAEALGQSTETVLDPLC